MSTHHPEAAPAGAEKATDPARQEGARAIEWRDGRLYLLDQRLLPGEERWLEIGDSGGAAEAIRELAVRGAPAIGITAAYAVVLAAGGRYREDADGWRDAIEEDLHALASARPTAVNLFWALDRMRRLFPDLHGDPVPALAREAERIHAEDVAANHRIGEFGAELFTGSGAVITHCNTGSLATGGYGTALGVIRSAHARGMVTEVFACETRPWLQGARLTAWELQREGIPCRLITDSAAAALMRAGGVERVITGADRVAANGDVVNKIGTYALAVAARHHGIPFDVAAPVSTIDPNVASGAEIPIEERDPSEVLGYAGHPVAPEGTRAWNPVFDLTPSELVEALITERGVARPPDEDSIHALLEAGNGAG